MTTINVQKKGPAKETGLARPYEPIFDWEPFRRMRQLLAWDPFAEMTELPAFELQGTFMPAFEVKEAKDSYIFKADMPGLKEADLDLQITGDRLTVSGKREMEKKEEKETFYAYERSYGSFSRSFTLPTGVDCDHAKAELKDGVLTLVLPKVPEAMPRKIEVRSEKVKA
jgi:HSP20 family protein